MKKFVGILGILLITLATNPSAGQNPPTAITAKLAYQQGLFFQRTVGNLEKALESYDRALKAATEVEDPRLLESILLRRAECFRLLGQDDRQQTTIAALQKDTRAESARLGVARFFPPESDMIFQVNLAALLSAPLLEKLHIESEIKSEELEQALQILGFDPLKDLHKVTLGVTLSDNPKMPAEHWLIHAEGNLSGFRPDRLIESGEKHLPGSLQVPRTLKIHGVDVLVFKVPLPENHVKVMTIGVAFLGKAGVLAGDLKVVKSTLAARAGKTPGLKANPKLAGLTGQVPQNSTFWLAGVPTQIIKKLQKMEQIQIPGLPKNLPEVAGLMLSGRVTEDLEATGLAFAEDLQSARLLGDILKGVLALAQLVPTDEPLLQKFLGSLRVEIKEREVKVSLTLPGQLLTQEECCPKGKKKPCCPEEAERMASEAKRMTEENKRMAEESKRMAEESKRMADESKRMAAEAERMASEELRAAGLGSLTINASPWAVVYVDGQKVGNTPLLRVPVTAGRHEITLENKEQGIRQKLKVVVEAGKETRIMKMLKQK